MPGRNGSGPEGAGPKTGKGAGNCGRKGNRNQSVVRGDRQGQSRGAGRGQGGRERGNQR